VHKHQIEHILSEKHKHFDVNKMHFMEPDYTKVKGFIRDPVKFEMQTPKLEEKF
jgi:hypothetical protein